MPIIAGCFGPKDQQTPAAQKWGPKPSDLKPDKLNKNQGDLC